MDSQQALPACSRPWIEWRAGMINDPVTRLRFLQTTAPVPEPAPVLADPSPRRRRFLHWALTFSVVAVILACFFGLRAGARVQTTKGTTVRPQTGAVRVQGPADVWQVEKSAESEVYSNGLRIDSRFAIYSHPRSYLAFPAGRPGAKAWIQRTEPAGIVFHTTESHQAPFEASENGVLKKIGESLVEYVRRIRAYNFLIDRFGRVYRIVTEGDAANHAGYSVWADDKWVYVNLNESFLGVSFEAKTEPGQTEPSVSSAQLRAAAMLTEMLRNRYGIAARNCVTHAQVSVNPSNLRVGYHTDWASSFPFEQLGLPDNYSQALPALATFGFEADAGFTRTTGSRMSVGVELAEQQLQAQAEERGLTLKEYRKALQKRYRERLEEQRAGSHMADGGEASE